MLCHRNINVNIRGRLQDSGNFNDGKRIRGMGGEDGT